MRCVITSPTETKTYEELRSVVLPTVRGMEQIMRGHAEYITRIKSGDVRIEFQAGSVESILVENALCWVAADEVWVIL